MKVIEFFGIHDPAQKGPPFEMFSRSKAHGNEIYFAVEMLLLLENRDLEANIFCFTSSCQLHPVISSCRSLRTLWLPGILLP
jgi:hypothetical protein